MTRTEPIVVVGPDLTAEQLHDLLRLRVDVFVVEQVCPYHEIDGRDLEPETEHWWFETDGGIGASVRVLSDPAGRRIGRVVTRINRRGEGLAGRLIRSVLARHGHLTTVLDAQSHLRTFYESLGYQVTGPEFIEDGIPHLPMTRPADTSEAGTS